MNVTLTAGVGKQQILEFMQSGQHAEAIVLLQNVCHAAPANAEARYLLGCSQARLGAWSEAVAALRESIALRPDIALTHLALADALRALGQVDDAAVELEKALHLDDRLAAAHVALAEIKNDREDFPAAREHLNKALAVNPRMSRAHLMLGTVEQTRGDDGQAVVHLKKALEYDPQSLKALCMIGSSLMNLACHQEAREHYQVALDFHPHSVDAVAGLALVYEHEGEYEKAVEMIEPLMEKTPPHVTLAIVVARTCRYTGRCAEAVEYIGEVLKLPGLYPRTRATLHFVAARILDRREQYDAAFSHYEAANKMVAHLYDAVGNAQAISDLIRIFTREAFFRLPTACQNDSRPVFIVGMPRSGTSLTEQILASHPAVHGAGELETLNDIVQQMPYSFGCKQKFPHGVNQLDQDNLDRMAGKYLQYLSNIAPHAQRVVDKMPHNFYLLGLIQLLFPKARVIHCSRHPLDTGLSIYFQNFNDRHDYAKDLFYIGVHYHQYQRLMEHWRQVLSLPVLEVRYEELVGNQEAVTRQLLEFCGLEWDDSCLQFHKLERTVNTASYDQVRQPLYTKSVERWRHYESYLEDLKDGLRRGY